MELEVLTAGGSGSVRAELKVLGRGISGASRDVKGQDLAGRWITRKYTICHPTLSTCLIDAFLRYTFGLHP